MTASGTPGLFTATPEYIAQCGRRTEEIQGEASTISNQAFTEVAPIVGGRWAGAAAMKAREIVLSLEADMKVLLATLAEFSVAIQQAASTIGSQEEAAAVSVGQAGQAVPGGTGINLDINRGPINIGTGG